MREIEEVIKIERARDRYKERGRERRRGRERWREGETEKGKERDGERERNREGDKETDRQKDILFMKIGIVVVMISIFVPHSVSACNFIINQPFKLNN